MNSKKLYLGLDLGTDSCGWALTDDQYHIIKKGNKALWGVRLFDGANTASDRRMKRSNRRRLDRTKFRLGLLQELFSDEIAKIDPYFFLRLNQSFLQAQDKTVGKYSLFNEKEYTDKEFYRRFPTIYHLRSFLMNTNEKPDIRWVYLACHHIIKYRGNFLMENKSISFGGNDVSYIIELLNQAQEIFNELYEEDEITISISSDKIENLLKSIEKEKSSKKIGELLSSGLSIGATKVEKTFVKAISGQYFLLSDLFSNDELAEFDKNKVSFSEEKYDEEDYPLISDYLGDDIEFLNLIKQIYDYFVLWRLLQGKSSISESMVSIFDEHRQDLNAFKRIIRKYFDKEMYSQVFRSNSVKGNYASYVRSSITENKKISVAGCTTEEFHKYIKKVLNTISPSNEDQDFTMIMTKLDNGTFLAKQKSKQNAIFPYQINENELKTILHKAERHYPFLLEKDVNEWTFTQKIVSLLSFRIPYYVGPLNDHHGQISDKYHSWVVRKEKGRVTPWNFEQKVDLVQSEERFILRMTNKCTYLKGMDVIAKNSLLYSEFSLLNEINALKISGEKITPEVKRLLIDKLFMKQKKVTKRSIIRFLKAEGIANLNSEEDITGVDDPIKGSLGSHIVFSQIFGSITDSNRAMIEHIIFNLSIFEDSKTAINRSCREFPSITEEQKKRLKTISFKGFGSLSKELLQDEIYHIDGNGEVHSIISVMRDSSATFMEVLNDPRYRFIEKITSFNEGKEDNSNWKKSIENSYTSPGMKRSIIQAMLVVEELKKITKQPINRFYVECTRERGKKERTNSRKRLIEHLYKNIKIQTDELKQMLVSMKARTDSELRSDKLFLYYTQLGKCMYTGQPIDLDQLENYDIDHIIPQSALKDDSLDNRVLVWGNSNKEKGDTYPISSDVQRKNLHFWMHLSSLHLISGKKLDLLTRQYELTDDEIGSFINRQLVFTNQAVKTLVEVLKKTNPDSQVIYSKAKNVSEFRDQFDLLKSRDINDFHHADDAFLNVVVGNTYHTKFGYDARRVVQKYRLEKESLNTKKLFNRDVIGAWKADGSSIILVRKTLQRNDKLVTRRTYDGTGEFYNATLYPKAEGLVPLKMKEGNPLLLTERYGGYKSLKNSHYCVVSSVDSKGNTQITIEAVPILYSKQFRDVTSIEKHLSQVMGLSSPNVLVSHIGINSILSYDDTLIRIVSSVSGRRLGVNISSQMNSHTFVIGYSRIVSKHKEMITQNESISNYDLSYFVVTKSQDQTQSKDKILTISDNIKYYDIIMNHIKSPLFAGLSNMKSIGDRLFFARDSFIAMNVRIQALILSEMTKLVQNKGNTANLELLPNLAANSGKLMISQNITKNKVKIIDQSVTGYYESVRWSHNPNAI